MGSYGDAPPEVAGASLVRNSGLAGGSLPAPERTTEAHRDSREPERGQRLPVLIVACTEDLLNFNEAHARGPIKLTRVSSLSLVRYRCK